MYVCRCTLIGLLWWMGGFKKLYFKGVSSVNTSLSVKYNKHLKHCHFVCMKVYGSWWEYHDKYSTLPHAIFATWSSPLTVYFIKTGDSALKECSSYTAYLVWLQSSTRKPQWFQYLKLVFLEIRHVTTWSVFQNPVTHVSCV